MFISDVLMAIYRNGSASGAMRGKAVSELIFRVTEDAAQVPTLDNI